MAKIILDRTGEEEEIDDGSAIIQICEEKLGVLFGCKDGLCGTCILEIVEGIENLNEKNKKEIDMFPGDNERLACQCKINGGVVKIRY